MGKRKKGGGETKKGGWRRVFIGGETKKKEGGGRGIGIMELRTVDGGKSRRWMWEGGHGKGREG